MSRLRIFRALAVAALLAACEAANPLDTCACSLPMPYDIVYGVVTEPGGGAPVANATVHVDVGPPACQTAVDGGNQQADAAGRYRIFVTGVSDLGQMCVRLVALAPPGSGWRDSDTTRLTIPTPLRHPPDSVQVNLVLRAP
jgi:hypothetical protein